jgi:hypothetical protein
MSQEVSVLGTLGRMMYVLKKGRETCSQIGTLVEAVFMLLHTSKRRTRAEGQQLEGEARKGRSVAERGSPCSILRYYNMPLLCHILGNGRPGTLQHFGS